MERLADATTRNPHATEVKETVEKQEASGEKDWSRGRELNRDLLITNRCSATELPRLSPSGYLLRGLDFSTMC